MDAGQLVADIPVAVLQRKLQDERYRIRVRGRQPPDWSDWFAGLQVTTQGTDRILDGCLPDQGALHSVLDAIRTLNLPLLSVQYVEPDIPGLIDRLGHRQ